MRLPGAPRAGRGAQALLILVGARRLFQLAGRYDHDAMVRRTKLAVACVALVPLVSVTACGGDRPAARVHRRDPLLASALPTQPWEPRFARAATTLSANA